MKKHVVLLVVVIAIAAKLGLLVHSGAFTVKDDPRTLGIIIRQKELAKLSNEERRQLPQDVQDLLADVEADRIIGTKSTTRQNVWSFAEETSLRRGETRQRYAFRLRNGEHGPRVSEGSLFMIVEVNLKSDEIVFVVIGEACD